MIVRGEVIDGLGGKPFRADVGIRNQHIACLGTFDPARARKMIDARGLAVAPGFIDVHTHVERNISPRVEPFTAPNFVRQGVTTIITGNCGRSFLDLGKAFGRLIAGGTQVNVASFIGHNTIRQHVMGDSAAPPSAEQLSGDEVAGRGGNARWCAGNINRLEYTPGAFAGL